MADEIKGTEVVPDPGAAGRTTITDKTVVSSGDLVVGPTGDAPVHDPPARSALPDEPVADAVGVGQGAHTPPDPAVFSPDGRPREVTDGQVDGTTATGGGSEDGSDDLKGDDLDQALDDAGLLEGNKSKTADEKRALLRGDPR